MKDVESLHGLHPAFSSETVKMFLNITKKLLHGKNPSWFEPQFELKISTYFCDMNEIAL